MKVKIIGQNLVHSQEMIDGYLIAKSSRDNYEEVINSIKEIYKYEIVLITPKKIYYLGNKMSNFNSFISNCYGESKCTKEEFTKTNGEKIEICYVERSELYLGVLDDFVEKAINYIPQIDEIKKVNKDGSASPCYSYHIFLFPFKWTHKSKDKKKSNLECLVSQLEGDSWKRKPFKLDTLVNYNEYHYFHEFAKEAIYDLEEDDLKQNNETKKQEGDAKVRNFFRHLEYQNIDENSEYRIKIHSRKQPYILEIDSILLDLYEDGVGVLSYHLYNKKPCQSSPRDISNINQFGRRIFPPFFRTKKYLAGKQDLFDDVDFCAGRRGTQEIELAKSIELVLNDIKPIKEDFDDYQKIANIKDGKFLPPKFIRGLFPDELINDSLFGREKNTLELSNLLDDRMFVVCWYGNNAIANILSKEKSNKGQVDYHYEENEWWYKYLFLDTGRKTCQHNGMANEMVKKSTNGRWVDFGTLYGVSRYSFVAITNELPTMIENNSEYLLSHVQTMYYKMAHLCLVQRAFMLNYSDKVTELANIDSPTSKINDLYLKYVKFVNKIYFREITAQEQGIELYDMLQSSMRIPQHVEDLKNEINELHQFGSLKQDKALNKRLELLTILGALFLVPSLVTGFYGMNVFDGGIDGYEILNLMFSIIVIFILLPLILYFIIYLAQGRNINIREQLNKAIFPNGKFIKCKALWRLLKNRRIVIGFVYLVLLALILVIPYCNDNKVKSSDAQNKQDSHEVNENINIKATESLMQTDSTNTSNKIPKPQENE